MRKPQETWVPSLGQKDPLQEEMATHSSILASEIPWTEELGGLQSMGSQRVRHNLATGRQLHESEIFHLVNNITTQLHREPWEEEGLTSGTWALINVYR